MCIVEVIFIQVGYRNLKNNECHKRSIRGKQKVQF